MICSISQFYGNHEFRTNFEYSRKVVLGLTLILNIILDKYWKEKKFYFLNNDDIIVL